MADYEPYDHRVVKKPLKYWEALVAVIKSSIGAGCLGMPNAFNKSGYVVGLILTLIIGFIVGYALHILIQGFYKLAKRHKVPLLTFPQAITLGLQDGPQCLRCLTKVAGYLCDAFLFMYHFGICGCYVIFVAKTISQVVCLLGGTEIDVRLYCVMLLLPCLALFMIRNLKYLVPFAVIATILLGVGIIIVLYYAFKDMVHISQLNYAGRIQDFPMYFGTVLFAIEAPGVMIAIEADMKNPKRFLGWTGVLSVGTFIVVILYWFFGFMGYWGYGIYTANPITLNLPADNGLSYFTKLAIATGILLSYPLQGYVSIDVTWHHYWGPKFAEPKRSVYEYLYRTVICILSVGVAIGMVDWLDLTISLIGSFCLSILGLVCPAMLDLCIRYVDGYGKGKIYLIRDIFLIVFGICGCIMGTGVAIWQIIEEAKRGKISIGCFQH